MCDLDPKVKVIDEKAGICDGVPSTAALVKINFTFKKFNFLILKNQSERQAIELLFKVQISLDHPSSNTN